MNAFHCCRKMSDSCDRRATPGFKSRHISHEKLLLVEGISRFDGSEFQCGLCFGGVLGFHSLGGSGTLCARCVVLSGALCGRLCRRSVSPRQAGSSSELAGTELRARAEGCANEAAAGAGAEDAGAGADEADAGAR